MPRVRRSIVIDSITVMEVTMLRARASFAIHSFPAASLFSLRRLLCVFRLSCDVDKSLVGMEVLGDVCSVGILYGIPSIHS